MTVGIALAACGADPPASTTSPSPAGPAAASCTYEVRSGDTTTFGPDGGTKTVTVVTAARCGWVATSSSDWITVKGGGEGTGEASINVPAYAGDQDRSASVSVAQQTIPVQQQACAIEAVQPSSFKFSDAGGARELTVQGRSGCAWSATGVPEWIQLSSKAGTAPATITLTASANAGTVSRELSLTIANRTVNVHQDGVVECAFQLQPASLTVAAPGGTAGLRIDAPGPCSWAAGNVPGWLTVRPARGEGSTTLAITAEQNGGESTRTATLQIGGESLTVQQPPDPAARLTIKPVNCGRHRPGDYVALCVVFVDPAVRPTSTLVSAFVDRSIFGYPQQWITRCTACGFPPIVFDMDFHIPADMTPGLKTFAIWATDAEGRRAETIATVEIVR